MIKQQALQSGRRMQKKVHDYTSRKHHSNKPISLIFEPTPVIEHQTNQGYNQSFPLCTFSAANDSRIYTDNFQGLCKKTVLPLSLRYINNCVCEAKL
jgi:hypothetical protein